jgi:hypothetical protein
MFGPHLELYLVIELAFFGVTLMLRADRYIQRIDSMKPPEAVEGTSWVLGNSASGKERLK